MHCEGLRIPVSPCGSAEERGSNRFGLGKTACFAVKWLTISLFAAGVASADCISRPMTPAEREYAVKVAAALDAAAPAAPEGWVQRSLPPFQISDPCDKRPGAFKIERSYTYVWEKAPREADLPEYAEKKKLEEDISRAQKLSPEQEKEVQALYAAMREKSSRARQAERAGDKTTAAAHRKEAEELYSAGRKIEEDQRLRGLAEAKALQARVSELNRIIDHKTRREMTLTLTVNEDFPQEPGEWTEVILFGAAKHKPAIKAQSLRVYLNGGQSARQVMAAALDRPKLEGIVK